MRALPAKFLLTNYREKSIQRMSKRGRRRLDTTGIAISKIFRAR